MGVSTTLHPSGQRRGPMQERSQETVGRVLASAGRLLARGVSPQSLTTSHIAAEAGLSVGALYRFFPDKQAIVDAIALRHLEAFQESLAAALMADLPDSPAGFLDAVIDGFAAYLEAHTDFRTLAYGAPADGTRGGGNARAISGALFDAQLGGAGEMAGMVREMLSGLFGLDLAEDFDFRLRIAAEIGDRLFAHAVAQPDAAQRVRVLAQAKDVLGRYLFPG